MDDLFSYIPMVRFISQFLGNDSEVILYDAIKKEVVYIESPLNANVKIGDKLGDLEQSFIAKKVYIDRESVVNYRAFSYDRRKLRSATYFIKDKEKNLIGMLTINYKVEQLIEMRNMINSLISGSSEVLDKKEEKDFYESFNLSFEELMTSTIQEALKKYNVPAERLSHEEKMDLIKTLDEKGTFLIKGSIPELAKILNTTETTIYRYINRL